LIILLETQIYSKKMQKARDIFEDNYIDNTNLYLNLYYMAKARELHSLQNLTINWLRQYYATKNKIFGFKRCDQVYHKTKSRSPIKSIMIQQFLLIYTKKKQTNEITIKASCVRLQMMQNKKFINNMFEINIFLILLWKFAKKFTL